MPTVSFQAPTDYSAEAEQIARSRKYAELMQEQSMQPMGGTETVGGWAIRKSPFEGLAKALQGYGARKGMENADAKQKALAEKIRTQGMADVSAFTGALQGTPAVTDINQTNQGLDSFDPKPAQAGDKQKALAIALQSQNPLVAGAGQAILADMLKSKEWSLGERFNPTTGAKEKFMYRKDDPTQTMAMGGQEGVSPDTQAKLKQADEQWRNLSANQQQQLGMEAARLGISVQQLILERARVSNSAIETNFNTTGGAGVPNIQIPQIPQVPPAGVRPPMAPQGAPAAPQMPPQAAPAPQAPAMPPQPVPRPVAPPAAPAHADGLTPAKRVNLAADKAQKDQDAARQLPQVIATANQAIQNIDDMIGDLGRKLPEGVKGKEPHAGFQDLIGATYKPGARFIPGTNAADFEARLDQVKGGAFLQAFEALKGGGQITEIEGAKATAAINRMQKSQSEDEFVKAAREYQDVMRGAVERAQGKAGQPAAYDGPDRRTSAGKIRVYNPKTGKIE